MEVVGTVGTGGVGTTVGTGDDDDVVVVVVVVDALEEWETPN